MGEVAGSATPPAGGEQQLVREISAPLFAAKGWMKFLGVLMIIYGILIAITIVGLIICWLPIWIGVILFRAATAAETAQVSGSKMELREALSKLKTYFTIYGVLALIGVIFFIFAMIIGGVSALIPFMNNGY
jgi:ABC-type transport system involved in cytochrome c biogenesis permease subunit